MGTPTPFCEIKDRCGVAPLPLLDLLAACVVYQHDLKGVPVYALNVQMNAFACEDIHTIDCSKKDVDAESILRLVFVCDCCDNLAVNVNVTTCGQT